MTGLLLALAAACLVVPPPPPTGPGRWQRLLTWRPRRARDPGASAVDWLLGVAGELRAGSDPSRAVQLCSRQYGIAPHAARAARLGADIAEALLLDAEDERSLLAGAAGVWDLTTNSGAGLADVLERMADSHRRSEDVRRTLDVELAAPRATARMMSMLPLVGVALGVLLGADPIGWLTTTPAGLVVLCVGVGMNISGYLWIRSVVRSVEKSL